MKSSIYHLTIFIVDVLISVIAFIAVGSAAVAVNFFMLWLKALELPILILQGLLLLEYIIFLIDFGMILWLLLMQAKKLVKHLGSEPE